MTFAMHGGNPLFLISRIAEHRYIGGYGRMSWVEAADFKAATPDPLTPAAARILSHMNEDHADASRLYARTFTTAHDAESAVMTGSIATASR